MILTPPIPIFTGRLYKFYCHCACAVATLYQMSSTYAILASVLMSINIKCLLLPQFLEKGGWESNKFLYGLNVKFLFCLSFLRSETHRQRVNCLCTVHIYGVVATRSQPTLISKISHQRPKSLACCQFSTYPLCLSPVPQQGNYQHKQDLQLLLESSKVPMCTTVLVLYQIFNEMEQEKFYLLWLSLTVRWLPWSGQLET